MATLTPKQFFNTLVESPQPTRTEVLEALETLTRNYNQDYTRALLTDFEELLNDWKYTKVVTRLKSDYDENVLAPYYEALHRAEYAMAMGSSEPIEWPEEPQPFCPPAPFPCCYDDSLIFVAPMYEYAVEVLKSHKPNNQDFHNSTTPNLSSDFSTKQAQTIFKRLVENGYCIVDGNCYKWKKTTALLAYCIDQMSRILELRPSNDRIPWRKFESVFGLDKSGINTCCNEVSKYTQKSKDKPEGWRELDTLLR